MRTNSYGGVLAEVDVHRDRNARFDTYRFDELNRLRDVEHGRFNVDQGTYPHRFWMYSAVNGEFNAFVDENWNNYEVIWDAWGNVSGKLGQRDANTEVGHQSHYRPVSGGDPDETRMSAFSYAPAQGNATNFDQFGYDAQGRLIRRSGNPVPEAPNGQVTEHTYTDRTEPAVGQRRGGVPWWEEPEKMPGGLLRTTTTAAAGTTTHDYNPNGDVSRVTDPNGRHVTYEYDNLGRRVSETEWGSGFPAGVHTQFVLDAAGRVIEEIHPYTTNSVTGMETRRRVCRVYDADGLQTKVVETAATACPTPTADRMPGNRTTEYGYDNAGRLTRMVDPGGGVTTHAYRYTSTGSYEFAETTTEPDGRVVERRFHNERLVEVVATVGVRNVGDRLATMAKYAYDPAGRLVEESDALGRRTRYEYTWDDYVSRAVRLGVRQPNGSTRDVELFRRSYDGMGRVTSETTGGRRTVESYYDGAGKLVDTILDRGGLDRKEHRLYDPAGRLSVVRRDIVGADRENVRYTRDAAGYVQTETVENGEVDLVTRYVRDSRGSPVTVFDPRGEGAANPDEFAFAHTYDELARLRTSRRLMTTVEREGKQPAEVFSNVVYGYNTFGELTHVRGEDGNVTETVYDDAGRVTEVRGPSYTPPGSATPVIPTVRRGYTPGGRLREETDARGQIWIYGYDMAGNLYYRQGPEFAAGLPIWRYTFDEADQLKIETGPTGARVAHAYDGLGRQVATTAEVRQPTGGPKYFTTSFEYDDVGNLTATVTAAGHRTRMSYNAAGERTVVYLPGVNQPIQFSYDVGGRVTRVTDPAGRITDHEYDPSGRPVALVHRGPSGELDASRAEYDLAGNVVATVAPSGARTTYTVDRMGRVTGISQPVSATESITVTAGYDRKGNRTRTTDGRGNSTWVGYNTLGLPETVTEPATAAHPEASDRRWTTSYDAGGLPVKLVKPGGVSLERFYDTHGRLDFERGSGGGSVAATRDPGYDLAGQLVSINHPGGLQRFDYSDRGLLLSSTGPASTTTFGYDADGRMSHRLDPGDASSSFTWRGDGQLATVSDSVTGSAHTYNYHSDTGEAQSVRYANGSRLAWGRDPRGRIASVNALNAADLPVYHAAYTYDRSGNVTSKDVTGGQETGGTYEYDLADRLTTWRPETGGPEHRYSWDAASSRTGEQTVAAGESPVQVGSWSYDERNRLTASRTVDAGEAQAVDRTYAHTPRGTLAGVTAGQSTVDATFDAFDRLAADGSQTYGYDGLDRLASRNSAGFSYAGLEREPVIAPLEFHARGPAGELIASRIAGLAVLPVPDAHGDVVGWQRADQSSSSPLPLAGSAGFDPFGVRIGGAGTRSAMGFQGDWTDPDTGKVNMSARWYQPAAGGFASRDDIDLPFSSGGLNRYGYGASNPVTATDPTGHLSCFGLCNLIPELGNYATDLAGFLERQANNPAVRKVGGFALRRVAPRLIPGVGWVQNAIDAADAVAWAIELWGEGALGRGEPYPETQPEVEVPTQTPPAPPPPPPVLVHESTTRVVDAWSTMSTWAGGGYRHVRLDSYLQTLARTVRAWSNGAWWDSGWFEESLAHWWQVWSVKTVDPNRVEGEFFGDILPGTGGVGAVDVAGGSLHTCGIASTLVSCLAEVVTTPVGGGCAQVSTGMHGCTPGQPTPGPPNTQRETARSQINLDQTCHTGGWDRPDTSRAANIWTCSEDFSRRIDPFQVRFSQDSASENFSDGGTIWDLKQQLDEGTVDWSRLEPIRLVEHDGELFTLDNRRLAAFQMARMPIPYRMATEEERAKKWPDHYTTTTDGIGILLKKSRRDTTGIWWTGER